MSGCIAFSAKTQSDGGGPTSSLPILKTVSGSNHECDLYENKKVRCRGQNHFGQLGLGHTQQIGNGEEEDPVFSQFVDVGADVEQISVGHTHTCALLTDRNAKCWGSNHADQLGLGHFEHIGDNEHPSSIPVLDLGEPLRQIVASYDFTCALTESWNVKCWGDTRYGTCALLDKSLKCWTCFDKVILSPIPDGGFIE